MRTNSIIIVATIGLYNNVIPNIHQVCNSELRDKADYSLWLVTHLVHNRYKYQAQVVDNLFATEKILARAQIPFIKVLPDTSRYDEFLANYSALGIADLLDENFYYANYTSIDFPVYYVKRGFLLDNMEAILRIYREFYNE